MSNPQNAVDRFFAIITTMEVELPKRMQHIKHRDDWSDTVAMRGAREILKGVKYPDDATRRSLCASWLRVFASDRWHNSFDGLMLDCVAATPSATTPGEPLFASIYKVRDPVIDNPYLSVLAPVLKSDEMPALFGREREPVEPLPTSPGIIDYLADLIRKSRSSKEALDEACLIIGFYSLALAVVAAKSVGEVQDFFRTQMKKALAAAVPTSYGGDVFCPSERFLTKLALKTNSSTGLVKPFLVILVLGQYAYHVNAGEAGPSADTRFLEEGYLKQAKFGHLEVVELQYSVQEKTCLSAAALSQMLRKHASTEVMKTTCEYVHEYLNECSTSAKMSKQNTRPWCRTADDRFFWALRLCVNLDYATRLTALLAPDPNDRLWQRPEFSDLPAPRVREALSWAVDFKRAVRSRKYEDAALSDACEAIF